MDCDGDVVTDEPWLEARPHRLASRLLMGIEQHTSPSLVGEAAAVLVNILVARHPVTMAV
jgi:hypothetical protein